MLNKLTKGLKLKMMVSQMSMPQAVPTAGAPDHFVHVVPRQYKLRIRSPIPAILAPSSRDFT
ncbi:MAG TPA: hypothetical protein DEQ47_03630 [Solibacterales bacterium]|nr:hypothetical protein [Bryobacterales bacterium]